MQCLLCNAIEMFKAAIVPVGSILDEAKVMLTCCF